MDRCSQILYVGRIKCNSITSYHKRECVAIWTSLIDTAMLLVILKTSKIGERLRILKYAMGIY